MLKRLGVLSGAAWVRKVVWVQLPLEVMEPQGAGSQEGVLELRATAPLRLLADKARLRVELLEVRLGAACSTQCSSIFQPACACACGQGQWSC